jgi:hypothetical protein
MEILIKLIKIIIMSTQRIFGKKLRISARQQQRPFFELSKADSVTRLGKISSFGRIFLSLGKKFFVQKIAHN